MDTFREARQALTTLSTQLAALTLPTPNAKDSSGLLTGQDLWQMREKLRQAEELIDDVRQQLFKGQSA